MKKILFVCTGNICRSPTAHGVLVHKLRHLGLHEKFYVASAGLMNYHVGESPDSRTLHHAGLRGYDLSSQVARHFKNKDFLDFDDIFAMDRGHLESLLKLSAPEHQHKIKLWLTHSGNWKDQSVPDPYYGTSKDFELVLDMVEDACEGYIKILINSNGQS